MGISNAANLYDKQLFEIAIQNFNSISYNVTAIAQNNNADIGPAYLLNGLTKVGNNYYWYQVGLGYNWSLESGGHAHGFQLNYNAFNATTNTVIDPSDPSSKSIRSFPIIIQPKHSCIPITLNETNSTQMHKLGCTPNAANNITINSLTSINSLTTISTVTSSTTTV